MNGERNNSNLFERPRVLWFGMLAVGGTFLAVGIPQIVRHDTASQTSTEAAHAKPAKESAKHSKEVMSEVPPSQPTGPTTADYLKELALLGGTVGLGAGVRYRKKIVTWVMNGPSVALSAPEQENYTENEQLVYADELKLFDNIVKTSFPDDGYNKTDL
jgi:hypothetical protein